MAGSYSDISLVAPSSAAPGSTVAVEAKIKNLCASAISLTATMGKVDGTVLRFGAEHKVVGAGETASWSDSFVMPDKDVKVYVESWYRGADNSWHPDDSDEKNVNSSNVNSQFGSIEIMSCERR